MAKGSGKDSEERPDALTEKSARAVPAPSPAAPCWPPEERAGLHRTLVDSFPDGALLLLDKDENVILAGGEALRGRGLALEGKRLDDFLLAVGGDETFGECCRAVFDGGAPPRLETTLFGEPYEARFVPVPGKDGRAELCLLVLQDMVWRKAAESALRERERIALELEAAFQAASDGLIFYDPEGGIRTMNPEAGRILGYSREIADLPLEERCRHLESRLPGDEVAAVRRSVERALAGETVEREELAFHVNGSREPRHILASFAPVRGPGGENMGVVLTLRDVTRERELQDRLREALDRAEQASRVKSEFLANMSHEIRTPLNGLLGMAELALMRTGEPKVREYLELARVSGKNLLDLISDILDLSKIEAGRVELRSEPFDPAAEVARVMDAFLALAAAKGLTVTSRVEPDVPRRVTGDPGRLRQVLFNLVGNAVKFTDKGAVAVFLSRAPGPAPAPGAARLLFRVEDTGIGIPREEQPRIFESFASSGSSTHRLYGGPGLGLSIAGELVAGMGGEICVESGVGRGSTFSFTAVFGPPPRAGS